MEAGDGRTTKRRLVFVKDGSDQRLSSIIIPHLPDPPGDISGGAAAYERDRRPTKPEIPRLKRAKKGDSLGEPLAAPPCSRIRQKSTMPSPGVYKNPENPAGQPVHEDIPRLSSVRSKVRQRAAESLVEYVDTPDKAREICSLLPSEESPEAEKVRAHCLELLKQEMEKTSPKQKKTGPGL